MKFLLIKFSCYIYDVEWFRYMKLLEFPCKLNFIKFVNFIEMTILLSFQFIVH